jgi:hypothetical protein
MNPTRVAWLSLALGLLVPACSDSHMLLQPIGDGGLPGTDGSAPGDAAPPVPDGPPASSDAAGDHGPVITFLKPTVPTAHGTIAYEFTATDANDPVDTSTVKVWIVTPGEPGAPTPTLVGPNPARFAGTIDLTKYNPPLVGSVLVNASVASMSVGGMAGIVGTGSVPITIDNDGPTIVFENPLAGQFVGGTVTIKVSVTDISGVDDMAGVFALVGGAGGTSVPLKRVTPSMPDFVGVFDFHSLGTGYALPTLGAHAVDTFGNATDASEEIVVDNVPPLSELDPPSMRVSKLASGVTQCSTVFDPVGLDSANDGFAYPQVITLRARIEDGGNNPPGLAVVRISAVDPANVNLLVMPAGGSALVVDTDGDGSCDEINPNLVPVSTSISGSNQVLTLPMAAMAAGGGAPDYEADPGPEPAGVCGQFGDGSTAPPVELCPAANTPMTFALPYTDVPLPAIWTLPPVANTLDGCTGLQFDSHNVPEGPACIAVRAVDNAGNVGVSKPLRVCISHGQAGSAAACAGWPTAGYPKAPSGPAFASPPDCSGVYNKTTMMVSGSCTTPGFAVGAGGPEVRPLTN